MPFLKEYSAPSLQGAPYLRCHLQREKEIQIPTTRETYHKGCTSTLIPIQIQEKWTSTPKSKQKKQLRRINA